MNKKANTALFILAATIGTTLLTLLLIIIPILILGLFLKDGLSEVIPVAGPIIFIAGIIGSFLIYSQIMKKVSQKVDLEKYFHPILTKKKKP